MYSFGDRSFVCFYIRVTIGGLLGQSILGSLASFAVAFEELIIEFVRILLGAAILWLRGNIRQSCGKAQSAVSSNLISSSPLGCNSCFRRRQPFLQHVSPIPQWIVPRYFSVKRMKFFPDWNLILVSSLIPPLTRGAPWRQFCPSRHRTSTGGLITNCIFMAMITPP